MKKIVFLVFFIASFTFAQVDRVAPQYDLTRPNPKTTAEINTMTRMVEGSEAWNTDTNTIWRYVSGVWTDTGVGGGGGTWGSITGTLSAQTDLQSALDLKANLAGATFSADISVPDEAYSVSWNGSLEVPTKNAVYDEIESVVLSGGGTDDQNISGSSFLWTSPTTAALTIGIENGASELVDLSSIKDSTLAAINTFAKLDATVADQGLVSEDRANTFAFQNVFDGSFFLSQGTGSIGLSNEGSGADIKFTTSLVGVGDPTFDFGDTTADRRYTLPDKDGTFAMLSDVGGGSLSNIVEDTTPQLGGTLDAQSNLISGANNIIPDGNNTRSLGSISNRWGESWFGDDGFHVGTTTDITSVLVSTDELNSNELLLLPTDIEPTATKGRVYFDDSESTLKQYNGTAWEAVGTDDQTGSEISLTPSGDIASTDVQAGIVELDSEKVAIDPLSPYQDVTIAIGTTAAMDAAYGVDPTIPNGHIYYYTDSETTAVDIGYDNTTSGLTATNVKAAIDEVAAAGGGGTDDQTASEVSYDNTISGLTATDVKSAIDELDLAKIADDTGTVDFDNIVDGTIRTEDYQDLSVTAGKITALGATDGHVLTASSNTAVWSAPSGGGTFSGSIADNQIAVGSGPDALEGNPNFTYDSVGNIFKLDSQSGAATDFIQEHEFGGSTYRNTIDGINSSSYWTWQNLTNGQQQQIAFGSTSLRPVQNDSLDLGANLTAWKNIYGVELHDTDGGNSTEWTTTRSEWQSHLTALGSLTSLAEANLVDKEIRYVENAGGGEYAVYAYDATAVSGDAAPLDQTGGTGFWQKIASSSFQASAFNDDETVVQDNLDNTKELQFNLDAIGSGVTRTITMLDENVDLSALTASNLAADAVSDSEIDYTNVTLADFTNDANLVASVGSGRTGVIPITETYAQSQEDFDLDGAPPANHHVVITNAQVTSAEIEDATIVDADMAAVPNPANATAVDLSSILGNRYVASANAATTYTTTGLKAGGWAKVLINAASEPAVTGGTKIAGSTFASSTDMYMVVYTDDGTNVEFYFLEI